MVVVVSAPQLAELIATVYFVPSIVTSTFPLAEGFVVTVNVPGVDPSPTKAVAPPDAGKAVDDTGNVRAAV